MRSRNESGAASAASGSAGVSAGHTPFIWPLRIYWEDTDAGGVVYHASYVRFFERARTEWLRAAGMGQQTLLEQHGLVFVVHGMDLRFIRPARLDDMLEASVSVTEVRSTSFKVEQLLRRADDGTLLVSARVRIACLDQRRWRPHPIPEFLLQEILKS
jgi:acyl-CoA thioester hydrolase